MSCILAPILHNGGGGVCCLWEAQWHNVKECLTMVKKSQLKLKSYRCDAFSQIFRYNVNIMSRLHFLVEFYKGQDNSMIFSDDRSHS